MAIMDFAKDSTKSISLHIHNQELGPEGLPLYFHTPETPAVIEGHVQFSTTKETTGDDIILTFQARAESKWTEQHGKATIAFHGQHIFQEQTWDVKLAHSSSKKIASGVTRYDFKVELNPGLPTSLTGKYGWFQYRFFARLHRSFPHRNMAAKQSVWVNSSCITADAIERPITIEGLPGPKVYQQVWEDVLPVSVSIPSDIVYQGQMLPVTIDIGSFMENTSYFGQQLVVSSAVLKMKQYTKLIEKKIFTTERGQKKQTVNIPVMDWPLTNQSFSKTIMVEIPGPAVMAATMVSDALCKRFCLKLIMMVHTNTNTEKEAKELRVEMDLVVTAPRPEHVRSQGGASSTSHFVAPPAYAEEETPLDDFYNKPLKA